MTAADDLGKQFIEDLTESFRRHGAAALEELRETGPQAFREIVELVRASLVTH